MSDDGCGLFRAIKLMETRSSCGKGNCLNGFNLMGFL